MTGTQEKANATTGTWCRASVLALAAIITWAAAPAHAAPGRTTGGGTEGVQDPAGTEIARRTNESFRDEPSPTNLIAANERPAPWPHPPAIRPAAAPTAASAPAQQPAEWTDWLWPLTWAALAIPAVLLFFLVILFRTAGR